MAPLSLKLRSLFISRSVEPISSTEATEAIDTPPTTPVAPTAPTEPSPSPSTASPSPSTPGTPLIITVIILSILVAFSLLYLSRLLWTRYVLPKRERRRSKRLLAEKKKAWEGMAVYFDDSAALRRSVDAAAAAADEEKADGKHSPKDGSRGAKKARTFSDDLWSAKMDEPTRNSSASSSSCDSDEDERNPPQKGRGSPYRTWRPVNTSDTTTTISSNTHSNASDTHHEPASLAPVPQPPLLSQQQQQQQQYGIARGSGLDLGLPHTSTSTLKQSPTNPFAARRRRHTNTSFSSVTTSGTTSSSILYSPLVSSEGSPCLRAGTAVAARGQVVGVGVKGGGKRRSVRFMSLGNAEKSGGGGGGSGGFGSASGSDPLRMNPVGEGDLVDVPLVEVDTPLMGRREVEEGPGEGQGEMGLGIRRGMEVGRESWPLRS